MRYGLSERRALLLLALIATGIGLSSLAYNVLDNVRWTIVGVVFTFALLVQFASFLADIERRSVTDGGPVGFSQAFAVHWRRVVEVLVDFVVITGSFVAAYAITFGWPGTTNQRFIAGLTLPVILAARYLTFIPFGLYRSVWRYAGARDAVTIACAVVISEVIALAYMVLTQGMRDFTRDFFIVDALICMVAVGASRFAERAIVVGAQSVRDRTGRRSLIVGAGRTGRSMLNELRETAGERVLGFVDDNPRLRRRKIKGVPVLGAIDELDRLLERTNPDIVLVTIPDADRAPARHARRGLRPGRRLVPLRPARGRPRPTGRPRHRRRVNSTAAESPPIAASRSRALLDRAFAALPLVGLGLAVVTFYCVEAWTRKTVWVFTDELEWTQISRAIEETGHSARRGDPVFFKSLYAYVIAPFWAIDSTSTAYAAIKYAGAILMSLAAIPTYLLARMMLPKRTSVLVAVLAVFIPGMAYASSLIPEVIAYPWFALCSWLVVRAMATGQPRAYVWAGLAAILAPLVRNQFATVPAAVVLAGAALWITGARGRHFRRDWTRGDTIGAVVLLVGAFILFNRVVMQHSYIWQFSTEYWKGRMLNLGLQAGLAFIVGMGILPVIGGLASLRIRERLTDPVYRAFVAWFAASLICLGLYTAVKATYLSTTTLTVTEERNLIYLAPLMLIGTALVFHSRRINWWLVAAACAFVAYLVLEKPFQLLYPYFEAPGFSILTIPNRHWRWDNQDLQLLLLGLLAVSVLLLVWRRRPAVAAAAVVLVTAWLLTAQIAATVGFDNFANGLRSGLPQQLDWVDRETGGQPVTFLGQAIIDANGVQSTEFWNRSIRHVYSLDSTAPGPGPTVTPDVVRPDGTLDAMPDNRYVLAGLGVALQGKLVRREGAFTLYRRTTPTWKLRDAVQHVYSDGWAGQQSAYTYFKPGQRGTLVVNLGRTGFNGDAPPGVARIRAGTVKILPKGIGPAIDRVTLRRRTLVENGKATQIRIPVARTPVRVELNISPTFHANAYDPRDLGAQVAFQFVPAKQGG